MLKFRYNYVISKEGTMAKTFIERELDRVCSELNGKDVVQVLNEIAERSKKSLVLSAEDQSVLGAVLGAMLHKDYCDSRRLPSPNQDGLINNPRPKVLNDPLDANFIERVHAGDIPLGKTLYLDDRGRVVMDIANTDFINLSPHWQKDNFMAGCAASRTVVCALQNKELLDNPQFREFAMTMIGNAIHEAWLARENIYYDEDGNQVYTNKELNTAFVQLPADEKDKDLKHYVMARSLIEDLYKLMREKRAKMESEALTGHQPGEE